MGHFRVKGRIPAGGVDFSLAHLARRLAGSVLQPSWIRQSIEEKIKIVHSLEEIERLQRKYKWWVRLQALLGIGPVFALVNKFHPMLTDGYGEDLIPTLLPEWMGDHYPAILAICLAGLAASEILRRRFQARHKDELEF